MFPDEAIEFTIEYEN
ncbi:TPA: DUF1106 domain-containing protein [Escherichia coli]|nr:DUF1106 domain-containing protein [Escherichia coli]